MKIDKETTEKIKEIQLIEQNVQQLSLQKQTFQIELNETENALKEVEKSKQEVYKIIGQVMLKTSQEDAEKELKEKKDILNLRIKSIEQQESIFNKKLDNLRREVEEKIKK